jgi:hypothetical protein
MASPTEPGESLARIDLPIRDVLRFIVPGGFAAISSALMDHLLWNGTLGIAHLDILVPVGFIFGLIAFVGEFHARLWPWKKHWKIEIGNIAREITAITGSELARREELAKPIYKLWIEAVCPPGLRGYLHYTTGIYYTTAAVSVYSATFACLALARLGWALLPHFTSAATGDLWSFLKTPEYCYAGLSFAGFSAMTLLSYRMSKGCLLSISNEGRVAMQLDESRDELVKLARAATRAATAVDDRQVIGAIVEEVFRDICPADRQLVSSSHLDRVVTQLDVRDGSEKKIAHISVESKKPFILNGGQNLYVGEQQRVLEAALALRLCAPLNVDGVRLQIGPVTVIEMQDFSSALKRVSRVTIEDALSLGVLTPRSPVVACAKEFGIEHVIVRGRFVIGPSPALASCLKKLLKELPTGIRVLDPFAGTRLVEKVCRSIAETNVVYSYDRIDQHGDPTTFDAFNFVPHEEYDLVVIDPLYEDCLAYLAKVAPRIKAKYLIVQSGRACDLGWNAAVYELLKQIGNVEVPAVDGFGSSLFFVTRH